MFPRHKTHTPPKYHQISLRSFPLNKISKKMRRKFITFAGLLRDNLKPMWRVRGLYLSLNLWRPLPGSSITIETSERKKKQKSLYRLWKRRSHLHSCWTLSILKKIFWVLMNSIIIQLTWSIWIQKWMSWLYRTNLQIALLKLEKMKEMIRKHH